MTYRFVPTQIKTGQPKPNATYNAMFARHPTKHFWVMQLQNFLMLFGTTDMLNMDTFCA